ncbi:MAG: hypothetical protein FJ399_02740 [Verrucomicrobia bacterium]|nr:hypothetical protein [Verrucomicrobiota bacterium]
MLGLGNLERLTAKAESFVTGGRPCRLISLEALIAAREAMSRENDHLAAKELRAIAAKRAQRNRPAG